MKPQRTQIATNLATALGLPPDTPMNITVSRFWNMHAINRATEIKKQYDLDHPPAQERSKTKE
jgi:hypothetical protein